LPQTDFTDFSDEETFNVCANGRRWLISGTERRVAAVARLARRRIPEGDSITVQPVGGNSYVAQLVAQSLQQPSSNASSGPSSNAGSSQAAQDTLSLSAAALKAGGGDPDGDGH